MTMQIPRRRMPVLIVVLLFYTFLIVLITQLYSGPDNGWISDSYGRTRTTLLQGPLNVRVEQVQHYEENALPGNLQKVTYRKNTLSVTKNYTKHKAKEGNNDPLSSLEATHDTGPKSHRWQSVDDVNSTFIYSAYYDNRTFPPSVRIIAISKEALTRNVFRCKIWFKPKIVGNPPISLTVSPDVLIVPEGHSKRYNTFVLKCQLMKSYEQEPTLISLVRGKESPTNQLQIMSLIGSPVYNFTVCVTPLNFNYNNFSQLIEMIEINRLFGASYLIFYNYSIGPRVNQVLEYYANEGLVQVMDWNIPAKVDTWPPTDDVDIHYFGQLAALNDCLYRTIASSKFTVFTDLDEFIVPHQHKSWIEIIETVDRDSQNVPAYYSALNTFFRLDWTSDKDMSKNKLVHQLGLRTMLATKRETTIHPFPSRSKYICRPRLVNIAGVHSLWDSIGSQQSVIPPEIALLHHYRNWENPEQEGSTHVVVEDRTIHRFSDSIVNSTLQIYLELNWFRKLKK